MWLVPHTPQSKVLHRLLQHERLAFLIKEDILKPRLLGENLSIVYNALHESQDDAVLYAHWFGHPVPPGVATAMVFQVRIWDRLYHHLNQLRDDVNNPDLFTKTAESVRCYAIGAGDLARFLIDTVNHPLQRPDEARLRRIVRELDIL
jgi:hypothetical protein